MPATPTFEMQHFFDIAFTPSVIERQRAHGSFEHYGAQNGPWPTPAGLSHDEQLFLTERDSFYLSSVGEDGWPYVQHRGGPIGFVTVLGPTRIAWAERLGNRQFVTAGHIDADDRVALIAVDYPNRRRLKLYGHATYVTHPTAEQVAALNHSNGRLDAIVYVDVVATDWNCPKHITPRYTADEVRALRDPLTRRVAELEAQLADLRAGKPDGERPTRKSRTAPAKIQR